MEPITRAFLMQELQYMYMMYKYSIQMQYHRIALTFFFYIKDYFSRAPYTQS